MQLSPAQDWHISRSAQGVPAEVAGDAGVARLDVKILAVAALFTIIREPGSFIALDTLEVLRPIVLPAVKRLTGHQGLRRQLQRLGALLIIPALLLCQKV